MNQTHHQLAGALLDELGGRDNIISVLSCATSRLRLELKDTRHIHDERLRDLGVSHIMRINDRVVHLLMGDRSVPTGEALNSIL